MYISIFPIQILEYAKVKQLNNHFSIQNNIGFKGSYHIHHLFMFHFIACNRDAIPTTPLLSKYYVHENSRAWKLSV